MKKKNFFILLMAAVLMISFVPGISLTAYALSGFDPSFESGTSTATVLDGSVVDSEDLDFSEDGGPAWTIDPSGSSMLELTPSGDFYEGDVSGDMEIPVEGVSYLEDSFFRGYDEDGNPYEQFGDFAYMYADVDLDANQSYEMAWNYVAGDYVPWNDGAFATCVNLDDPSILPEIDGTNANVSVLAANVSGTGKYITGSYGSTGWQTITLKATAAGTYRIGFAVFNLQDESYCPTLFLDDAPGATYKDGDEFEPVPIDVNAPPVYGVPDYLSVDRTTIDEGEESVISFDSIEEGMYAALFEDGELIQCSPAEDGTASIAWDDYGPADDMTIKYILYDTEPAAPSVDDAGIDRVAVTLIGSGEESGGGDTYSLTASKDTVSKGDSVIFTTDAPEDNIAAFFLDGEYWGSGSIGSTPNPFPWDIIGEGNTEDVLATYRIYDFSSDEDSPEWDSPYLAQVQVTFTLDPLAEEDTDEELSDDASLSDLTLSSGTLSPAFSSGTAVYTASVDNSTGSITILPVLDNANATISAVTLNDFAVTGWTASSSLTLNTGSNTIEITVTAEDGTTAQTYTITVTRETAVSDNTNHSSSTNPPSTTVLVDGQEKEVGDTTTKTENGRSVTTVTIDTQRLDTALSGNDNHPTVTIPITADADVKSSVLTGQMVKSMENKDATLVIQTSNATYTLPASEINIDAVSQQLGQDVQLSDINVAVDISEPSPEMTKVIENAVDKGTFSVVVPAVEFSITCDYNGTKVEVSHFNSYIERTVAIPDGVDPAKITTGVVIDPDGTVRHVPTKITVIDGKYYAVINSLTNSTYSVIWHPVEFTDAASHWAKDAINDMGSRMVVNGDENGNYNPNNNITRAEFAAIVVRALGLETEKNKSSFDDVASSDWFNGYIGTAFDSGLINGYSANVFGANGTITRQDAMTIISRAMKIAGIEDNSLTVDAETVLAGYQDAPEVSPYAKEGVTACLKAGLVNGRGSTIAPKDSITRAEVAVIVERLLKKAELI